MKVTKIRIFIASLFCVSIFLFNAYALPGDLDPTFDLDGKTVTSIGNFDEGVDVAIQSDGKIVMVGSSGDGNVTALGGDVALVRYNADGSLDTSFGTGGKVLLSQSGNQRVHCLTIQSDGKILVIGSDQDNLAVFRFNADGSLDTTFGTGGKVTHDIAEGSVGSDAVIQPDGKIVIAGAISQVVGDPRFTVFRLNANGALDTSFNSVGYKTVLLNDFFDTLARTVALQSDGKIVAGGLNTERPEGYWTRLNADGTVEGGGGLLQSGVLISDVAIQSDGKIVFAGDTRISGLDDFAVTRFNADKTVDVHFGNFGINSIDNWGQPSFSRAYSLFIQPSGRIVVGGNVFLINQGNYFALARFNSNGFLDSGFGNAGKVITDLGAGNEEIRSIAPQADGKIIAAGFNQSTGFMDFAVARYDAANSNTLSNRTPFDYDGDGRADISVLRPSTNTWYLFFSGNSSIGAQPFGASGDIAAPADYDGDAKTDLGIFRPSTGQWWYLSSATSIVNTVFWGQAGDIPRPGDFDADGKPDFVFFRPSNNTWYSRSSVTSNTSNITFGLSGDKPLVGDFDGDGKSDPAVFRPSTGDWWYAASSAGGQTRGAHWGTSTDIPAPADYDGDNQTDIAVYRPSDGVWYIFNSANGSATIINFGLAEDKPVPADYDGDGRADIAVFRPSTGIWYLLRTTAGFSAVEWGVATDLPTQNVFIP